MDSLRLLKIAEMVKKNSIVADIGTDHGYLPVYLMEEGLAKRVIGTDISSGSLKKIETYIRLKGYEDKIDTRLGDGLEVIKPFEVDTVIISGLGGILMTEILENSKAVRDSVVNLILQPMVGRKELRKYLHENSFRIINEEMVYENNKYYEVIHAQRGMEYIEDEIYYEIPKSLIDKKDPILIDYLNYKLGYYNRILDSMEDGASEKALDRKREIYGHKKIYREVLNQIEG